MEPLSATASIIAVLQLTGVVVNYLNTVKNASKDQKRCAIEASNLFALLTKLKYLLEEATPTDHLYATAREIITENGILDQYKAALERLVAKVVPKDGARKVAAPFLWPLDKKEIDEIFETIERLKSQILIILEIGHLKLSQAIKEETKLISSDVRRRRDDEQSKTIADWLSPIDVFAKQTDLSSRQQEGTGTWFLESQEFRNWVDGFNATLFCSGIPGAGKTMLSSLVVNHLRKTSNIRGAGVVFLYCNYKEDKERGAVDLLSALLKQLVQELPHIPSTVQALYSEHEERKARPSLSDISTTIRSVFNDYATVFIVVDALDECPDEHRNDLLSVLQNPQASSVRLMVTARPINTICEKFKSAIQLPIKAQGDDIKRLVEGQLPRLAHCVSRNQALKQLVISTIHDAVEPNGM
ncbi:hypothetical protein HD806DRAFT_527486 [Xylariaceae sp. AK1471]|nr:hypothetical protein HD806DRAFT_527486 [Xylariaceae sp. AK1471]